MEEIIYVIWVQEEAMLGWRELDIFSGDVVFQVHFSEILRNFEKIIISQPHSPSSQVFIKLLAKQFVSKLSLNLYRGSHRASFLTGRGSDTQQWAAELTAGGKMF